uniref:Mos1 transposase HTH domain-containing protein n=1 Tax=Trichuris muris TaxID=70415 RepID=A0A5S6PYW8_TRIMR
MRKPNEDGGGGQFSITRLDQVVGWPIQLGIRTAVQPSPGTQAQAGQRASKWSSAGPSIARAGNNIPIKAFRLQICAERKQASAKWALRLLSLFVSLLRVGGRSEVIAEAVARTFKYSNQHLKKIRRHQRSVCLMLADSGASWPDGLPSFSTTSARLGAAPLPVGGIFARDYYVGTV